MQRTPHLLIIDDDREIRDLLARFLVRHELRVDTARDGREMDAKLATGRFDLLVLDLMMPGEDGLAICRRLRGSGVKTPIIMLTALGEEADRIVGLEVGADDYLPKPFNPRELLARIRAVLRRTGDTAEQDGGSGERPRVLTFEGWQIDLAARELRDPEGTLVTLTSGEFDMLEAFAERPQQILSRDQLADLTTGRSLGPFDRSIDVALSRLRRKLGEDPKNPRMFKTVRHGGYYFSCDVTAS
ncbi:MULTISPECIES: response regulator [unclassified Minwuia]|jgi:two-component system, OmpR family, response regulator|uniref:response regulator n=1 Tax=unclassified Minwuia TaxID=2618799 RepID=UPI00247B0E71|nr:MULTISPECIES: response regulator [unclassified Minwuia]